MNGSIMKILGCSILPDIMKICSIVLCVLFRLNIFKRMNNLSTYGKSIHCMLRLYVYMNAYR